MNAVLFDNDLSKTQWTAMRAINRGEVTHDFASDTYSGALKSTVKSLLKKGYVHRPNNNPSGKPAKLQLSIQGYAAYKARVDTCKKHKVDFPGI